MGGSFRRSFFGLLAFALVLLALSVGPVYAQLDYAPPAPPAPAVQPAQPPAQPAVQAPAQQQAPPAQAATGNPKQPPAKETKPVVQLNGGLTPGNPTWLQTANFTSALVLVILLIILIWRTKKIKASGVTRDEVEAIAKNVMPKLPTVEEIVEAVIDDLPPTPTVPPIGDIVDRVKTAMPAAPRGFTETELVDIMRRNQPTLDEIAASVQMYLTVPTLTQIKEAVRPLTVTKDEEVESIVRRMFEAPINVYVNDSVDNAILYPGQSITYKARVSGPPAVNPAVTWTISPADAGEIKGGTFTAPPTHDGHPTTVVITATSVADPTKSGSVQVHLYEAKPASGKKGLGVVAVFAGCILLSFGHAAYAAPRCYNPATAPRGATPSANNAIPLAVVGVSNTMVCAGNGAVQVVYLNGTSVPVTGNAHSFTFTPPTRGRARIKVGGVDMSMLVIDDAPVAVQLNAAIDLARESVGGVSSGGADAKTRLVLEGAACGASPDPVCVAKFRAQAWGNGRGTSAQAGSALRNAIIDSVFHDDRFVALKTRSDAAQAQADAVKAKAEELEAKIAANAGGNAGVTEERVNAIVDSKVGEKFAPLAAGVQSAQTAADEAKIDAGKAKQVAAADAKTTASILKLDAAGKKLPKATAASWEKSLEDACKAAGVSCQADEFGQPKKTAKPKDAKKK